MRLQIALKINDETNISFFQKAGDRLGFLIDRRFFAILLLQQKKRGRPTAVLSYGNSLGASL